MHATERGELLARMEHRCLGPGDWLVEGHRVRRLRYTANRSNAGTRWFVHVGDVPVATKLRSFTEALRVVADRTAT